MDSVVAGFWGFLLFMVLVELLWLIRQWAATTVERGMVKISEEQRTALQQNLEGVSF